MPAAFASWSPLAQGQYSEITTLLGPYLLGSQKHVLKRVAAPLVPQEIVQQKKQPYRVPDALSFVSPARSPEIDELLSESAVTRHGVLDPKAVAILWKKCDEDGCLWYVGRFELVIKSSGFRFSPREIDEALALHPSVVACASFGVDDPALGQAVEVAVVTRPEEPRVEAAALLGHLRQRLPRYMLPRHVHFVDELPRNPNGKIRTSALRALAQGGG